MKKIFIGFAFMSLLASSCRKTGDTPFPHHQQPSSQLVEDWIDLHIGVIKNTSGISHIGYARHFAYSGLALYEAMAKGDHQYKSISGKINGSLVLPVINNKQLFWPAAGNAAIAEMLRHFYGVKDGNRLRIDSLEQAYFARYTNQVHNPGKLQEAVAFGKQVAAAVAELAAQDGASAANIPYTPIGEGFWEPTPPMMAPAGGPGWGNNKTILKGSIDNTIPGPPVPFSTLAGSPFHLMAKELYDVSQTLTAEQKAIADFWDDAPNGKYISAFGHWFNILKQVLQEERAGLMPATDAYLRLGISMNDAIISCWKTKFTYNLLRPVTYIQKHMGHTGWMSYISTPAHPEYSAAHATLSGSAGFALESVFGKKYAFTDHTYDELGMAPRHFTSLAAAGYEAGLSRLYGGIHYLPSVNTGNLQGIKVGKNVARILSTGK